MGPRGRSSRRDDEAQDWKEFVDRDREERREEDADFELPGEPRKKDWEETRQAEGSELPSDLPGETGKKDW